MKGVLLVGATGSRLHPLTLVTNKHLLPVHDRPMICHPIETLRGLVPTELRCRSIHLNCIFSIGY